MFCISTGQEQLRIEFFAVQVNKFKALLAGGQVFLYRRLHTDKTDFPITGSHMIDYRLI